MRHVCKTETAIAIGIDGRPAGKMGRAYFNPAGHQHGKDNPKGAHAGDLNNLTIPANGKLELQIDMPGIALRGEGGLLDEDGASLVIHANPDDYKTDPSGNSGARIACAPISIPDREE